MSPEEFKHLVRKCAEQMALTAVERGIRSPRDQHPMFGIAVETDEWARHFQSASENLDQLLSLIQITEAGDDADWWKRE